MGGLSVRLIAGLFGEDGDDGEAGVQEGGAWEVGAGALRCLSSEQFPFS